MFKLKYSEIYITNVCNLNCSNCNRFNNFAFSGHERWDDFQSLYEQWAQKIDIDWIGILGGEPLLNPDFMLWYDGILRLWPNSKVSVVTNGSQLSKWPGLYDLLLTYKDRAWLEITGHNNSEMANLCRNLEKFLVGPIHKTISSKNFPDHEWQKCYDILKGVSWPDCKTADRFEFLPESIKDELINKFFISHQIWTDANGVRLEVSLTTRFFTSAVTYTELTNEITLHNSDPVKAVKQCISKYCHHFSKGKLYKCGAAGLLPDFIKQFKINLSQEDREIINSYVPAETTWQDIQLTTFLENLTQGLPIPQCKFCSESYEEIDFQAGPKKIKIVKNEK
jgi:organic radical activating enzyme